MFGETHQPHYTSKGSLLFEREDRASNRQLSNLRQCIELDATLAVRGGWEHALYRAIETHDIDQLTVLADVCKINLNERCLGRIPIHLAVQAQFSEGLRLLVEQCAVDINAQDDRGWTALFWAIRDGDLAVVQFLVSFGSDLKHTDKEGWDALSIAVRYGRLHVLRFLCEKCSFFLFQRNEGLLFELCSQLFPIDRDTGLHIVLLLFEMRAINKCSV